MLNFDSKTSYNRVEQNMMILNNEVFPYMDGKHDCLESTCHSYLAYGDERFIDGIKSCWIKTERKGWLKRLLFGKYYYQGQRFPGVDVANERGMSKDHVVYSMHALSKHSSAREYASNLRWKISEFQNQDLLLWLWLKAISGKKIGVFYHPVAWVTLFSIKKLSRIINKITGGFGSELHQSEFEITNDKPKYNDFMMKLRFPTFSLKFIAFQLDALPESEWKYKTQKQCWELIGETNYLLKIMLRHPDAPTKEDVENYKPMYGSRWSGVLNKWVNDRYMKIIEDDKLTEFNNIDKDVLLYFYDKQFK